MIYNLFLIQMCSTDTKICKNCGATSKLTAIKADGREFKLCNECLGK